MYDAWAAYDDEAVGYLFHEKVSPPEGTTLVEAQQEAVSYAAYRLLRYRYVESPHPKTPASSATASEVAFDNELTAMGYSPAEDSAIGDTPAAIGNRVAETILEFSASDRSREASGYDDPTYSPVNEPLILSESGTTMADPNRWQPLAFDSRVTQNGIVAESVQTFVGSHWRSVRPFALHRDDDSEIYQDPGTPPLLGGEGDAAFKNNNLEVVRYSSWLDPDMGVIQDYSPASIGNNTLGLNDGTGYEMNPVTNAPYAANPINRGDYGRIVAEFWADGPSSETPPGHWNMLANEAVEHPDFERRLGGEGPELEPLEWDVKLYFALNASLHDVAVAVWNCKRDYDYVRPINSIRYLGANGLLPFEPGVVEEVTTASSAVGERHEHLAAHVGETAILAWGGEPEDPETEHTGAEWMLAGDWIPYQRATFVTPAFAGYVSGHSAFSQAAAEILTEMTGSPFFPGGLASFTVPVDGLEFEAGPESPVTLQWATYYDAADEAGISRLFGGIPVAADDGPGRIMGSHCGLDAWQTALKYYDGSITSEPIAVEMAPDKNDLIRLSWTQQRGQFYTVLQGSNLENLLPREEEAQRALEDRNSILVTPSEFLETKQFFKVEWSLNP
jgi:hypothetical protein